MYNYSMEGMDHRARLQSWGWEDLRRQREPRGVCGLSLLTRLT